jgi:hypothetical protein
VAIFWLTARVERRTAESMFRRLQLVSAAYRLGHGVNDAQGTFRQAGKTRVPATLWPFLLLAGSAPWRTARVRAVARLAGSHTMAECQRLVPLHSSCSSFVSAGTGRDVAGRGLVQRAGRSWRWRRRSG